jgi:hypothetical protein
MAVCHIRQMIIFAAAFQFFIDLSQKQEICPLIRKYRFVSWPGVWPS